MRVSDLQSESGSSLPGAMASVPAPPIMSRPSRWLRSCIFLPLTAAFTADWATCRAVPDFPVEGHIFWIVCLVVFVSVFRIECLAESESVCVCLLAFMNVFVYCLLIYVIF